jgi:hypothetical protein
MAIVDTATLRASTSCPTSRRLLDAREAISSSFSVIFSMVVTEVLFSKEQYSLGCKVETQPAGARDHSARPNESETRIGKIENRSPHNFLFKKFRKAWRMVRCASLHSAPNPKSAPRLGVALYNDKVRFSG